MSRKPASIQWLPLFEKGGSKTLALLAFLLLALALPAHAKT